MDVRRMMKAVAVAATAISTLLLFGVVTLGEVYAFILVGDGEQNLAEQALVRGAFSRAASGIDRAFKSGWGINPKNIAYVQAWEHSVSDVQERLAEMAAKAGEGDVFIFYYAGHGNAGAMHPWTGQPDGDETFSYSGPALFGSSLDECLEQTEGDRVVILDCCYAGTAQEALARDSWLLTSCGDEPTFGASFELYFSSALAAAIDSGATGVGDAFEEVVRNLAQRVVGVPVGDPFATLWLLTSTPHFFRPASFGGEDDLDIAEAATATLAITSLGVSGRITDVTDVSASGVAAGSASCNVTLELDSVSGEYRASCDYSVQADPARRRGSAHVSIRIVVPILPPLGSIELHASMDAEGAVQYGVFPNAQSDYTPGTMQGDVVIGGVRASFTGSGQMQGHTSGTSAQDVEVTLWFDMEADL